MSRILVLAAAVTLVGVTACNKPAEEAPPPTPAPEAAPAPAPAPEAMAPAPAESAPAPMTEEKSAAPEAAKPEAMTTKPAAEKPAAEMKPAAPAPEAKMEAPAKAATLTKDEAMALAAKGNCVACHKIEVKVVGPAWKDVGAKYKGDPNAVATIASHIKSGGSFGWKFGVMPPRGGSKISDAEVESLAKFIAGLK